MSRRTIEVEHSLLEIGTEVYRIKHEMARILEQQEKFSKALRGLKTMLDEKGLITAEDFDTAVDLTEILGANAHRQEGHGSSGTEIDWRKKANH